MAEMLLWHWLVDGRRIHILWSSLMYKWVESGQLMSYIWVNVNAYRHMSPLLKCHHWLEQGTAPFNSCWTCFSRLSAITYLPAWNISVPLFATNLLVSDLHVHSEARVFQTLQRPCGAWFLLYIGPHCGNLVLNKSWHSGECCCFCLHIYGHILILMLFLDLFKVDLFLTCAK